MPLLLIILLVLIIWRGPTDGIGLIVIILLVFLLLGFVGPFYPHHYPYW